MTKTQARRWVREWWADKMRRQDIPDTEGVEGVAEVFEDESRKLAATIERKEPS